MVADRAFISSRQAGHTGNALQRPRGLPLPGWIASET